MFVDHTVFYDIWSLKENRNVIINWVSYPSNRPFLLHRPLEFLQKTCPRVFFCKPWAPIFEVKRRWAPFLPGISRILSRFSANLNLWGCSFTPCTPTSNTTIFLNSIIGNFVVYQDRFDINLLQLFGTPRSFANPIWHNAPLCLHWISYCAIVFSSALMFANG